MRRLALVLVFFSAPGRPAAAQTAPPAPYRATWWDAASVTTAGALAIVPQLLDLPRGAPACAPCDPATLPGIDHAALRTFSGGAGTASHALLAGVIGFAGLASLRELSPAAARGNAAVLLNSLGWAAAASQWLKVFVHRNRPVLYTTSAAAAAIDPGSRRSFPSGHATLGFAAATSYLVISRREHLSHSTRNALVLYAGALSISALRVVAGKHFPTDVAGGALLGSSIGWLVPTVHPVGP